jgi:hypothetical protein
MGIFTKAFWFDAIERSIKTGAQFIIGAWGVGDGIFNIVDVDLTMAGGAFIAGVVLSVLTSIVSAPIGERGSPSLVNE